ncbi:MAG: hypothetical protein IPM16_00255 [Chloroflexi bacterium]|nr:hypothetical protein [Chloroflexota bacterium]
MRIRTITHVLIAGSRDASPDMLAYARKAVQRAHRLGWTVLVGDSPKGVDLAVVRECRRLKAPVIVAGTAPFPRNHGCKHGQYIKVARELYRGAGGLPLGGYTVRDRWLVDMSQHALFIWNGHSPGTLAGYEYAIQRGKDAHLKDFSPWRNSHV